MGILFRLIGIFSRFTGENLSFLFLLVILLCCGWDILVFWILRMCFKVSLDWKVLKQCIFRVLGITVLASILVPEMIIFSFQLQGWETANFVSVFIPILIFGTLLFMAYEKWVVSRRKLAPSKKNWFVFCFALFNFSMIFFIFFLLLGIFS